MIESGHTTSTGWQRDTMSQQRQEPSPEGVKRYLQHGHFEDGSIGNERPSVGTVD